MPNFDYTARTENGVRKKGTIFSNNYNEAMEKLKDDGLAVVRLTESDTSFDFLKPFLERLYLELDKFKNRVPINILVFFTRQLATMFSAGLTLERAIHGLAVEEKHSRFKKVLTKVSLLS